MKYYLLQPCRTTAAYVSTLKKPKRIDLANAAKRLERAGFRVEDLSVMLIVQADPELTLYASGKVLVKTTDEGAARKAIDAVYDVLGFGETANPDGRKPRKAAA